MPSRYQSSLLDHKYRVAGPDGQIYYVSEPYDFHSVDAAHLIEDAHEAGWEIDFDATYALWYPGHTTALIFTKK
jgi:hypothetical protein